MLEKRRRKVITKRYNFQETQKGLIFDILSRLFLIFYGLTQLLLRIKNICNHYFLDLLVLFWFLSNQKYLYTFHRDLELFSYIYYVFYQCYQKQIRGSSRPG